MRLSSVRKALLVALWPGLASAVETAPEPTDSIALLKIASAERAAGHTRQALALYRRGLETDPSDDRFRLELATTLWWNERAEEALPLYDALLSRNPRSLPALMGKARALLALERTRESREFFERATKLDAQNSEAFSGLGTVARTQLDDTTARVKYDRALELDANNQEAREGLRALEASTRFELTPTLRGAIVNGTNTRWGGGLRGRYRATETLTTFAGYSLDVASWNDPSALPRASHFHQGEAGTGARLGRALTLVFSYQLRWEGSLQHHGVNAQAYEKLSRRWVLMQGARPGYASNHQRDLFGFVGGQYLLENDGFVMLQAFGALSTSGDRSATLVPSARIGLGPVALRASVGYGTFRFGDGYPGSFSAEWRPGNSVTFGATYELFRGFLRLDQLSTYCSLRF